MSEELPVKRTKRGRPKKEEIPQTAIQWRVQATLVFRAERYAEAQRLTGTFVLLSNDPSRSPEELLRAYKGQQNGVEIPFRVLKALPITPVCLKLPERVEAFAWIVLMAYLVYAIMQYRVRSALRAEQDTLITPGGLPSAAPTAPGHIGYRSDRHSVPPQRSHRATPLFPQSACSQASPFIASPSNGLYGGAYRIKYYHGNSQIRSTQGAKSGMEDALRQSRHDLCRSLLDIRGLLQVRTATAAGLISLDAGAYLFQISRYGEAKQEYTAAIAAFDQALACIPADPEVYNGKGSTLARLGDLQAGLSQHADALASYKAAIAAYDWALSLGPNLPQARHARAAIEARIDRLTSR